MVDGADIMTHCKVNINTENKRGLEVLFHVKSRRVLNGECELYHQLVIRFVLRNIHPVKTG